MQTRIKSLKLFLLFFVFSSFLGCKTVKDAASKDETIKSLTKGAEELLGNTTLSIEELKKLKQVEYKVLKLALDNSPKELSESLNKLGKERWVCFDVERNTDKNTILIFCRRPVYTPLRYVPGSIIGR